MASSTFSLLSTTVLLTHLYAHTVHFSPRLSTGLSYYLVLSLALAATLLSHSPLASPHPAFPLESNFFTKSSWPLLCASLALLLSILLTTPRGMIPALATPRPWPPSILDAGPYAYIRHPLYLATILCFAGQLAATMGALKPEAMARAYAGQDAGRIGPVVVGLMAVVGCMAGLLVTAAMCEERALLARESRLRQAGGKEMVGEGGAVDAGFKAEYEGYVRRVPWRWVPGVV